MIFILALEMHQTRRGVCKINCLVKKLPKKCHCDNLSQVLTALLVPHWQAVECRADYISTLPLSRVDDAKVDVNGGGLLKRSRIKA